MRTGVRLGIDVGRARIGVAASDPHGMLAMPVRTVARARGAAAGVADVGEILAEAAEREALELVVGLPLSLSGAETPSTQDAKDFAALLTAGGIPVRLVDERLSTVSAQSALRASGRSSKQSRSVIDQAAAVVILQHALDAERASGAAPGSVLHPAEGA